MAGYLLDTSVLIALVDPANRFHGAANSTVGAMLATDLQFVSSVTLGEIHTGIESNLRTRGTRPPNAQQTLSLAQARSPLVIDENVAHSYGSLKAAMVARYMPNAGRSRRSAFIENWIDQATGLRLGVNENDLWVCAQALERDIFVIAADSDFQKIADAESRLKLILL